MWIYLLVINIIAFCFYAIDKWKAIHGMWRIRTDTLFGLALLGGAIGGLISMYIFRHKTKQRLFVVGLPMIVVVQALLVIWLLI